MCFLFKVSGQSNVRLPLESGGASDSVMVHLLSVSKGVGGGQDLNICISTESELLKKKSPPLRGNLFDV